MVIFFGSVAVAACLFYVGVLVQFLRESERETRMHEAATHWFGSGAC